ncbi:carbonic anhydrase 1-like [Bufo gargarizans]|uniref:carbonic anhydrase 1-like n=1 Tax=Bufo gargarizans TaxID=30331 RepID=UPI001CF1580A|nr:carbonic anhydrase 1-like [Bufo gargarizans]
MALNSIPNSKVPGGDGLPGEFYKKHGELLLPHLLAVFKDAYQEVDVKLLAKVLANRLNRVIQTIIHDDQYGFMPGKSTALNLRRLFLNLQLEGGDRQDRTTGLGASRSIGGSRDAWAQGSRGRSRRDYWATLPHKGPDHWHKVYPIAQGNFQSPIDIRSKEAKFDASLKSLSINYSPSSIKSIINIGHSFHVISEDTADISVVKGGPLSASYRLINFHFHWGPTNDLGSEHTVDGKAYSAELHLVHWNAEKYPSFAEASKNLDGCAVLTVFLQVGGAHSGLQKVVDALSQIKAKGKQAAFANFDPSTLLPTSKDYWSYLGSLTHPPLNECVTWIIFKEPISISPDQLNQFRGLLSSADGEKESPILDNHRPPQPLKGREVRASFS